MRPATRSSYRSTKRLWYVPLSLDARPASGPIPTRATQWFTGTIAFHRPAHLPTQHSILCTDKTTVCSGSVYSPECPVTQRLCRSSRCRKVELDSKSSRAAVWSGCSRWRQSQGRRTYTE